MSHSLFLLKEAPLIAYTSEAIDLLLVPLDFGSLTGHVTMECHGRLLLLRAQEDANLRF